MQILNRKKLRIGIALLLCLLIAIFLAVVLLFLPEPIFHGTFI